MVKKCNIFMIMWLLFFMIQGSSEYPTLRYELYCDSSCNDELSLKEEILQVYKEIVAGVDKDKRASLVIKNKELFILDENWELDLKKDTLIITIGNGNGTVLSGEFEAVLCANTVKPRSWIKSALGF